MKRGVEFLQNELDQIAVFLRQGSLFSFTTEELQSLRDETSRLLEKLASIQSSYLLIGLLGGTGVGKSTLMNALAGAVIASASHRRPHTEQALIYRYVGASLPPALVSTALPWREITHEAEDIQQILVCDLPDFDSLMGEHREYVISFLEHLDLLVWVTSPEKYADGRFYQFLQMAPKAGQNFYFVLNKTDLLFQGETQETGYQQLANITRRFREHITENGIGEPLLYTTSAQEALDSDAVPPWNQIAAFRHAVFQQRDMKQITVIKASNLDVEVQRVASTFQKEIANLEVFEKILEDSIKEVEEKRLQWVRAGQEIIDLWLATLVKQHVMSLQTDPSPLVGPGYGLALLVQEWRKHRPEEIGTHWNPASFAPPDEISASFRRRLEWVEDQLNHRILSQNLPASFTEKLRQILDISRSFEELGERFFSVVALRVAAPPLPAFWGFRIRQFGVYLLLLAFFLLAIGGQTAWQEVLESPGGANILRLLFSSVHNLFSAKGLAALISYALLNLFFALRFYRRYRKLLHKTTDKVLTALKLDLEKTWEEMLGGILKGLDRFRTDIQRQISALSVIKHSKKTR